MCKRRRITYRCSVAFCLHHKPSQKNILHHNPCLLQGYFFARLSLQQEKASGKPLVPTLLLGEFKKDAFDLICGSIIIAHSDEEWATCSITIEEANELASFMYENYLKINKASIMGLFGKKSA